MVIPNVCVFFLSLLFLSFPHTDYTLILCHCRGKNEGKTPTFTIVLGFRSFEGPRRTSPPSTYGVSGCTDFPLFAMVREPVRRVGAEALSRFSRVALNKAYIRCSAAVHHQLLLCQIMVRAFTVWHRVVVGSCLYIPSFLAVPRCSVGWLPIGA